MMIRQYKRSSYHRSKSHRRSKSSLTWVWIFIGILIGVLGATTIYSFFNQAPIKQAKSQTVQSQKHLAEKSKKEKDSAQRFEFYTLLPGMEIQLPDKNTNTSSNSGATASSSKHTQALNSSSQSPSQTKAQTTQTSLNSISNNGSLSLKQKPKQNENTVNSKKALEQAQASQAIQTSSNNGNVDKKNDKENLISAQFIVQAGIFQGLEQADALKAKLTLQGFNTRIQKVQTQEGHTWFRVTLGPFPSETSALKQKKRLEEQKIQGILILQRPNT